MTETSLIIEAEHLSKVYGEDESETFALRDASFAVHNGEFVAIMGPSGSGKSTLLHILGFLDRHSGGEYRFDGKTIDDYEPDALARVRNEKMGFVFQQFNLLPRATVLENVKLPLLYSGVPESQWDSIAKEKIEAMGLSHRINHTASQLSGGEKQRVAIARALVNNPSVIFADEPTGNLDSKTGGDVMEILQNLNEQEGKTIILITHETRTARYAERIIQVYDGSVVGDDHVGERLDARRGFSK